MRTNLKSNSNPLLITALFFVVAAGCGAEEPGFLPKPADIQINTSTASISRAENPIGINLNYLRDADDNRPGGFTPLAEALTHFDGNWLRYPGGKKSIFYRFALPPYTSVAPQTLGYYTDHLKNDVIDFDEFITLAGQTQANPYVVLAYHPDEVANGITTLQEYIDHAVGWVRYAKDHGSPITYWEVGNENWNSSQPTGWAEVVGQAKQIADAIKQVDPAIKVGTSFNGLNQLQVLLDNAGKSFDFVCISNYYPGDRWGMEDYSFFENNNQSTIFIDQQTFELEVSSRGLTTEFIIAECNSKQWEGNWNDVNNMEKAIVCMMMCAEMNGYKPLTAAMFWNTSWFDETDIAFNLLDPKNNLRTNAKAIRLWNSHWKNDMLQTSFRTDNGLKVYALKDAQGAMSIFIVNKTGTPVASGIQLNGDHRYDRLGSVYRLSSATPAAEQADTLPAAAYNIGGNQITGESFPAYSITVINAE